MAKNTKYQGPDYDREEQIASSGTVPSAETLTAAEATFRNALSAAGVIPATIDAFASMGPVLLMRRWEADQLKFSSPATEAAFDKALNAWGRASFPAIS